jgi:hypothetical protein
MTKAARWVEIAVGAFFLVSAAAKAFDMEAFGVQVSAYNVVKDAKIVSAAAYFALAAETLLGAALVAGVRFKGLTHLLSVAMIAAYSTLVAYAWQVHGLEDCGCLGQWIALGPVETLLKNVALVALIGFSWFARGSDAVVPSDGARKNPARPIAAAAMSAVFGLAAYSAVTAPPPPEPELPPGVIDAARPYARFIFRADGEVFNLGEGRYLVALLSSTCKHCRAAVPALNELFLEDSLPDIVGLMMGDKEEITEFDTITEPLFATHGIDTPVFMELLGATPPRLAYVVDGKAEHVWECRDGVPSAEITAYFSTGGD